MNNQVWTLGERLVAVVALAAAVFVALSLTGTLALAPPSPAGATQYCTEYSQYQYGNTCGQPLVPPLIAFQSTRDGVSNTEVYIMNTDGSTQTRLFANTTVFDGKPSWSPDATEDRLPEPAGTATTRST